MREGASLEEALRLPRRLDGFYTFLVGTADGFAVLRDPIACKPAVLAETDDWVAMASEYRSIAVLPGAEEARVWEPSPGVVYAWERVARDASSRRPRRGGRDRRPRGHAARELNQRLHDLGRAGTGPRNWRVLHPNGAHALACGLDADIDVEIEGHAGYYCAGMNQRDRPRTGKRRNQRRREHDVRGVVVDGNASQSAGRDLRTAACSWFTATSGALRDLAQGRGRRRPRLGRASERVHGAGGWLVVCGDAGEALGDSIYEARLYVAGAVAGLGADCVEKDMRAEHVDEVRASFSSGRGSTISTRRPFAGTARRGSSTPSRSTTPTDGDDQRRLTHGQRGLPSPRSTTACTIAEIQRRARRGSTTSAGFGAKRLPHFDDLLVLGASISRYPLEGYRERCDTNVTLGTRYASKPLSSRSRSRSPG